MSRAGGVHGEAEQFSVQVDAVDGPELGAVRALGLADVHAGFLLECFAVQDADAIEGDGARAGEGEAEVVEDAGAVGGDHYGSADFGGEGGFFEDLRGGRAWVSYMIG